MQLQLGLALPTTPSKLVDLNSHTFHKKRTFSQLSEHASETTNRDVMLPTLSLLPLTPTHCSTITKDDEEEESSSPVGWPPVNYWRKKLRSDNNYEDEVEGNDHVVWIQHHHGHGLTQSNNTQYVKVKMEGVGIARKVNLSVHHSFHMLKETLMDMFGKCHQQSNSYELAYQDKEGDWLLAEDLPWRSFTQCAQRLKLLKRKG